MKKLSIPTKSEIKKIFYGNKEINDIKIYIIFLLFLFIIYSLIYGGSNEEVIFFAIIIQSFIIAQYIKKRHDIKVFF